MPMTLSMRPAWPWEARWEKKKLGLAVGAAGNDFDGARLEAGGEQLAAVGLNQVQVQAGADGGVAGGALGEKEHGIFHAHGVGIVDLAEEFAGIGKLGVEAGEHLFAHGVAAGADAGSDGGNQIFRLGAELQTHAAYAGFDDTLYGSPPAGVEGCDCAAFAVGYEDGDAVGGLDAEKKAGVIGH